MVTPWDVSHLPESTARRVGKLRNFTLTVGLCSLSLVLANVFTWLLPRRFGLTGHDLGSSWSWLGGYLLDLPAGLAATIMLLLGLIGFAWRRHTHYLRAMAAWATAAVLVSGLSVTIGALVHGVPVRVLVFVLGDVATVAVASTLLFAASAMVGVLVATAGESLLRRRGGRPFSLVH